MEDGSEAEIDTADAVEDEEETGEDVDPERNLDDILIIFELD